MNYLLETIYTRLLVESELPDIADLCVFRHVNMDNLLYAIVVSKNKLLEAVNSGKWADRRVMANDVIVAMIAIKKPENPCANAWEVKLAAGPGYGKLLYGLAYAMSPTGRLMSDREEISEPAKGAWKKAFNSERSRQTFDDVDAHGPMGKILYSHPNHTADANDDCKVWQDEYLDAAYEAVGWEKSVLKTLEMSGDEIMKTIMTSGIEKDDFMTVLYQSVNRFFGRHFATTI